MNRSDHLPERWQQMFEKTQQEFETILIDIKMNKLDIDCELLEKLVIHHIRQSHVSIAALCKLMDDYYLGRLDNALILALAQWT